MTKRNVNLWNLEVTVLEEGTPFCAVEQGCKMLLQGLARAEMTEEAHHDGDGPDHDADKEDGDGMPTKEPGANGGGVDIGLIISIIGLTFIGVTLTIAFIAVRFVGER